MYQTGATMSFPAADTDRLTAALAPVTAGDVAERACDRCGLDFAACPTEILDAAERRAAELAPVVAPEVQAVLDARAAVVVAEATRVTCAECQLVVAERSAS